MECPSCGAEATGKFCSNCGAKLSASGCPSCGAKLTAGAKFCHACGATVAPGQATRAGTLPWLIAGGAVVALLLVLAVTQFQREPPPPPTGQFGGGAAGAAGQPPDLTQLSPREIADRLYDRTMAAAEQGKQDTVAFFAPKALNAYASLGPLDPDAHYHLGLLNAAIEDYDAALAYADTLQQDAPNHLYGILIRWSVARARGDSGTAMQARRRFLEHYDAELATDREEYAYHAQLLEVRRNEFQEPEDSAR